MSALDKISEAVDRFLTSVADADRPFVLHGQFILALGAENRFSDTDMIEVQTRIIRAILAKREAGDAKPPLE